MTEEFRPEGRLELDATGYDLGRRAAYRRVLGLLKAREQPFVVAGALALSCHLGHRIDGDLDLIVPEPFAATALAACEGAGFRVQPDHAARRAAISYAGEVVRLAWGLPSPLGGGLDGVWFERAVRARVFELRVRVAPLEELLWLRIATDGGASLGDAVVEEALVRHGAGLDWERLLARLAGLEPLLLAHVFLLQHRHGDAVFRAVPRPVVARLLARVNAGAAPSVEPLQR